MEEKVQDLPDHIYKYELKIQGLTQQVSDLNNQLMDARVDFTMSERDKNDLKKQVENLMEALNANNVESQEEDTTDKA